MNNQRYKVIIFWWEKQYVEHTWRFENFTIEEAMKEAIARGWEEPKWYKPWLYLRDHCIVAHN